MGSDGEDLSYTKLDTDVPMPTPRKFGGKQPGAGRPLGRRNNKSIDREAKLLALINDDVEERVLGHLTPLDVMALAVRKLLAEGNFMDAAEIAARMAPYRHGKVATVTIVRAEAASIQNVLAEMANDAAPPLIEKGKKYL